MNASALTLQPRLADATPLALVRAGKRARDLERLLGVDLRAAQPVGDEILSTRIEVPPGEWLLWPQRACALWVGAKPDALPSPVRRSLADATLDSLVDLVDELAATGVWCRDASLLTDEGWSRPRRADAVFAVLVARQARAISGVFVDRLGQTARLEIAFGGVCWTDRPALAIQWLLNAVDLPLPT